MKEDVATPILVALTILAIASGMALYQKLDSAENIAALGSFFGGMGSAIAILWIVFNAMLQSKSIRLQAEELQLQRAATQKIADATETATIISIVNLAEISIFYDTRSLLDMYRGDTGAQADLSEDKVWQTAIENEDFKIWLARRHEAVDIAVLASISAICGKYRSLQDTVWGLSRNNHVSELVLTSSKLAHLNRRLSPFNYMATNRIDA